MTVAPRVTARTMAPMPTMPHPMTITTSTSVTCARLTAWKPTDMGSMSALVLADKVPEGMIFSHGMTMYSFMAPLRCTPRVSLCWQAFTRPLRQDAQWLQLV